MKSSKRKICQAVALVLSALSASAAMATTPSLLGGGSSLVSPLIVSEISVFPSTDGAAQYFSVGSGKGQTAFLNNDNTQFSAGLTGSVDFANSDAPLVSAQISTYAASTLGKADGPLIQLPYIVTPITIPLVNAPTGTGPAFSNDPSNTPTVALDDDDLCGIFSGKLTDWNQVTNPDNGSPYVAWPTSKPIQVIYQGDNSGSTDLLTAHLAQVCHTTSFVRNGVTVSANSNISFSETQNFAGLFAAGVPANFHAATGSGGVAASLATLALSGAGISYLSPAFTNTFLAPSSAPAKANNLAVASLLNQTTRADVLPTFQNATLALGNITPPNVKVLAKIQTNWVPSASNPTAGYPISGTSNIIVSQCYANPLATSPSPAQAVVDFLNLHYASNAAIAHGNGFDTVPSGFVTAINMDFLSNVGQFNLDIGNTTICSGTVTGR